MEVAKAESFALHEESSSQQPMGSHPSIHDRKEEISFSPSSGPVEEQPIGKRQRLDEDQVDQEEDQVIRDPVRVIRLDEIDITKLVLIQSFSVRYPKQWKLDECQSSLLNSVRSRFEICYQAATSALDEKDYPLLSACFEMVDCYGGIIKDLVDCAKSMPNPDIAAFMMTVSQPNPDIAAWVEEENGKIPLGGKWQRWKSKLA